MSYKGKVLLQWLLILPIAFQFLYLGFLKINGSMEHVFYSWGYAQSFMYFIGLVEVVSAIGLFFKKTRNVACLAQVVIMVGAVYTHWMSYEYFEILINIGVIGLTSIIMWLEREKIMVPEEARESSLPY